MVIDLATKKGKHGLIITRKCGVVCTYCRWRGYRTVKFTTDLGYQSKRLNQINHTDKLRGKTSYPTCPKCRGLVVFTHVP